MITAKLMQKSYLSLRIANLPTPATWQILESMWPQPVPLVPPFVIVKRASAGSGLLYSRYIGINVASACSFSPAICDCQARISRLWTSLFGISWNQCGINQQLQPYQFVFVKRASASSGLELRPLAKMLHVWLKLRTLIGIPCQVKNYGLWLQCSMSGLKLRHLAAMLHVRSKATTFYCNATCQV